MVSPGKLVTREELQKRLWPADTFVDFDLGLNTAIKKIRAALGDSADNPRFVQTLPRRGYRFICPVEEVTPVGPLPAGNGSAIGIQTGGGDLTSAQARSGAKAPENLAVTANPSHTRLWLVVGALALIGLVAGPTFYRWHKGTMRTRLTSGDLAKLEDRGTLKPAAYESYSKGLSFLQADDVPDKSDSAIQKFDEAVAADPSYALAYGGLAQSYLRKYKTTGQDQWLVQAQENCKRALELDTTRLAGRICQGALDNGMGLYREAVEEFSAAIEIDPSSVGAYQGRARAYKGWNKIAEAEKDYQRAIDLAPLNWRGHSALAKLYFDATRYDEAAQKYRQAIQIKPDNGGLLSSLGAALMLMGEYDKAVPEFQEAIRLQPGFQTYENLGSAYLYLGRFEDSIDNFKKALQPNEYRSYGNLARAYFRMPGQRDLARKNYERAIQLAEQKLKVNPDDSDVNLMLGVYHAMLGEEEAALFHLDRAQQVQPDGAEVAFWGGVVYLQFENRPRALAWLRHALSLNYSVAEIKAAPELDSLRADPEFQQFMRTGGKPVALKF